MLSLFFVLFVLQAKIHILNLKLRVFIPQYQRFLSSLKCVLGGCENACGCLGPLEPWTTVGLLSWFIVDWAWPKCALERDCENACDCLVLFGALHGSRSAFDVHLACSKCVLGGCENACGCLGPLEPWTTEGLLSWCTGHGTTVGLLSWFMGHNSFGEALKTHVAVLGFLGSCTEVGLLSCFIGHGQNAFQEAVKTHVTVLCSLGPWTEVGLLLSRCTWHVPNAFWEAVKTQVAVLGSLGPCTEVRLLSWCTWHGPNAFWETVKTHVAV